ncbi:MAG: helix-turn-helix domain-containing protein [Nitrospira sp.]
MSEEALVKIKDCARILGMSAHSLYNLAKAGRVPSYSAGGKMRGVRVSVSEVRAALKRPAVQ